MRVIIREAAYNDLDRIYEWIARIVRALPIQLSLGSLRARNGSADLPT
jgi:hypothetical protein